MMTFTQSITDGIELIHEITFPFSTVRSKVYMKWDVYLSTDTYISSFAFDNTLFGNFEFYGGLFDGGNYDFQQEYTRYGSFQAGKHLLYTYDSYDGYHQEEYSTLEEIGFYDGDLDAWFDVKALDFYINDEFYQIDDYSIQMKVDADRPTDLASTVSCSSTYLTDTLYIMITKKDLEFTTTINFQLGEQSETIVEETIDTRVDWVIPASYLSEFGDTELKKTAIITAITYYDGIEIGTTEYTFTVLATTNMRGPQINLPTISPIDTLSKSLVGSGSACIKYISTMRVQASFTPEEGYTLVSWNITNGSNKGTKYESGNIKRVDFENVENPVFTITATDNRGFTNSKSFTVTKFYDYTKLTCNLATTKPDNDGKATLTVNGNFYNNYFSSKKNTLSLKYRIHDLDNDSYSDWIAVTPTISGNTYSTEIAIEGLGYKTRYAFEVEATDLVMTTSKSKKTVGQPVFDWNEESFHITPKVKLDNNILLNLGNCIEGNYNNNRPINAFIPCDTDGYIKLGYGSYYEEITGTNIYGDEINLISNGAVTINGVDITKLLKMLETFTTIADEEEFTADSVGSNYSTVSCSVRPIGNLLSIFLRGRRSSATTGNEQNEKVATLTVSHRGLAQSFGRPIVSFHGDLYGGTSTYRNAHLTVDVTDWTNDEVTIDVKLRDADSGIYDMYSIIYLPMIFK